jgi:transketolase
MISKDRNNTIQKAREIRRLCLELASAKSPRATHFGGSLSGADILAVLYFDILRYKSNEPLWRERDRFILSKGHCVLSYYAALHLAGFLSRDELFNYGEDATFLPGHPVRNQEKGIESTNGSLGMGLAFAIGNAVASRRLQLNSKIYVLMGDGECNEGSVWESAMAAGHFGLSNLVAIVDRNNLQQTGSSSDIMNLGILRDKFAQFGWNALEIDGHDHSAIYEALNQPDTGQPLCIVANTVKGKGFSFSEGDFSWHHKVLTKELYKLGLSELSEQLYD